MLLGEQRAVPLALRPRRQEAIEPGQRRRDGVVVERVEPGERLDGEFEAGDPGQDRPR